MKALIATDPYRPPVGDVTPEDLPFVVEGSEELPPARVSLHPLVALCVETMEDSQEETIDGVPKLHLSPYRKNQIISLPFLRNMATGTHLHSPGARTTGLSIQEGNRWFG